MSQIRSRLTIASAFALVGAIALTVYLWSPERPPAAAITALVAFLGTIPWLLLPAREDLDALLLWLAGIGLATAVLLASYLLSAYQPGEIPRQAAVLAGGAGIAALAWTMKRQWGADDLDLPNVLRSQAGLGPLRESNQVQFGAVVHPGGDTQPHRVDVYLQNCCAGSRQVRFAIAGPLLRQVRGPAPAVVPLGPLEVRRLTLPLITQERPGQTVVDVLLAVYGTGGRRIRLRRAVLGRSRSKLDPAAYLRVRLDPQPAALWESTLPAPVQVPVWQPRPGTLREELGG